MADLSVIIRRYGHSTGHAWWDADAGNWVSTRGAAEPAVLEPVDDMAGAWVGTLIAANRRGDEKGYICEITDEDEGYELVDLRVEEDPHTQTILTVQDTHGDVLDDLGQAIGSISSTVGTINSSVGAIHSGVSGLGSALTAQTSTLLGRFDQTDAYVLAVPELTVTCPRSVTYLYDDDDRPNGGQINTAAEQVAWTITYDGDGLRTGYVVSEL